LLNNGESRVCVRCSTELIRNDDELISISNKKEGYIMTPSRYNKYLVLFISELGSEKENIEVTEGHITLERVKELLEQHSPKARSIELYGRNELSGDFEYIQKEDWPFTYEFVAKCTLKSTGEEDDQ
jgi:hypothetical protein